MKHSGKYSIVNFMLLIFMMIIIGCGSSSEVSDNSNSSNSSNNTVCESIAGTYWWVEDGSGCNDSWNKSHSATIIQTDCNITVSSGGNTLTGSINGSSISWTGSWFEDEGTVTVTNSNLSVSNNRITGSANWMWSDGVDSCSGTSQISATKI